jgi:hypothetical protein
MRRFSSLLEARSDLSAGQQQKLALEQFAAILHDSRLHLWKPGDPIHNRGGRLLIGVASYSMPDLALLDALNDESETDAPWPSLDVFNCQECRSIQDFENYIPGIGKVFQTPVVGYWEDGVLKEKAWGKAGRDLLTSVLGVAF